MKPEKPSEKVKAAEIRVEQSSQSAIYKSVLRLRRAVALLLVALWVPTTAHCLFEAAGIIEGDGCCGADGDCSSPSCQASCSILESATYHLPKSDPDTPVLIAVWLACEFSVTTEATPQDELILVSDAPPELSATWQFVSRAALPVRAPSILS